MRRLVDPEEMHVGLQYAKHRVPVATYEESNWRNSPRIFFVLGKIAVILPRINERASMKATFFIAKVNPRRRCIRMLTELCSGIVRCDESCEHNQQVHNDQSRQGYSDLLYPGHRASVLIRGSLQYSNTSAKRLPRMTSEAESRTTAMTTYTSRARIDSRSIGPNPGQPRTTSTSKDALKSVPKDSPSSETSGLAAAGSAWRNNSWFLRMPYPRAACTKGNASDSDTLDRTCR